MKNGILENGILERLENWKMEEWKNGILEEWKNGYISSEQAIKIKIGMDRPAWKNGEIYEHERASPRGIRRRVGLSPMNPMQAMKTGWKLTRNGYVSLMACFVWKERAEVFY